MRKINLGTKTRIGPKYRDPKCIFALHNLWRLMYKKSSVSNQIF